MPIEAAHTLPRAGTDLERRSAIRPADTPDRVRSGGGPDGAVEPSVPATGVLAAIGRLFQRRPVPLGGSAVARRSRLRTALATIGTAIATFFSELLPKGLYARALIIIIAPIVLLESVVAYSFMERHWQAVTRRLSEATARDIAAQNLSRA